MEAEAGALLDATEAETDGEEEEPERDRSAGIAEVGGEDNEPVICEEVIVCADEEWVGVLWEREEGTEVGDKDPDAIPGLEDDPAMFTCTLRGAGDPVLPVATDVGVV